MTRDHFWGFLGMREVGSRTWLHRPAPIAQLSSQLPAPSRKTPSLAASLPFQQHLCYVLAVQGDGFGFSFSQFFPGLFASLSPAHGGRQFICRRQAHDELQKTQVKGFAEFDCAVSHGNIMLPKMQR